ncbi:Universal stress protein family [uncultured Synechococcales cyanobacterium]|uniref:Universal stress protein family n=1 Tax=uncultured Synechococcales cyanobacterium TaxID=1936017 RepID=A0A6J4US38_9CYAN|nr:Universal stress protein family [uncultured Synechococcales cyanobacterium]
MFKTILVALDSSELSERVVRSLDEFQIQPDTHVILAHVIPPAEPGLEKPADQPQVEPEISYQKIENQLQLFQVSLAYRSVREIVSGDPAEEIVRLANIYHADLIILGSRGLTGMERILQGSVSSQVAADAPCSVLVIKPS